MTLLIQGNALALPLASGSVHMVVTSPPYWGLRSYNTGDQKHLELGAEPTPDEYVANMVAVFREVGRVMRDDATLWLNLGDSYAQGGNGPGSEHYRQSAIGEATALARALPPKKAPAGLKPKDLCGIPWRVALALQADGWWLRSDIIWAKPNPMPESVTDRPTKAHEYLFLLSKSQRYYYDQEAIREPIKPGCDGTIRARARTADGALGGENQHHMEERIYSEIKGSNRRTVWTIATESFSGAHFATYPRALVEPCIKAGTSEAGVCSACGKQWERVVERYAEITNDKEALAQRRRNQGATSGGTKNVTLGVTEFVHRNHKGFRPACSCDAPARPALVFDPFSGSGTTGVVALHLRRRFVGVDLSRDYIKLAHERMELTAWDEWQNGVQADALDVTGLPLFAAAAAASAAPALRREESE